MNEDFERGDRVILLDRPMGHPSKIQGVIVGIVGEDCYNILLTNGLSKGKIKRVKFFEIRKEETCDISENKKRSIYNNSLKR
tara:strand:- start:6108 stop:6353 length:246 start_codon:yes stop_codon:yes gene_type:complete